MKDKKSSIAGKHSKLTMQNIKKRNPIHSDQVLDHENKEKIVKLCKNKFSKSPVFKQVDKIDLKKSGHSNKNTGSHSLSELYFFQNHHK